MDGGFPAGLGLLEWGSCAKGSISLYWPQYTIRYGAGKSRREATLFDLGKNRVFAILKMPTGTKLVAGIAALALALGVVSWWYRFEAAHRSTLFLGPIAAELIARPSQVTASTLVPAESAEDFPVSSPELFTFGEQQFLSTEAHDVTDVPGMVHLRNSLLTDSNYDWTAKVKMPSWQWCLQFAGEGQEVQVLFTENFGEIGLLENGRHREVSCRPMAETLREYFASSKLFDASKPAE